MRMTVCLLRGEESGGQGDIANGPPGKIELPGEEVEIDVGVDRGVAGQKVFPDEQALVSVREGELDDVVHASRESLIDILAKVGGENDDAFILLDLSAAGRRSPRLHNGRGRL